MSVPTEAPGPFPVAISISCSATVTRADGTTDDQDERAA